MRVPPGWRRSIRLRATLGAVVVVGLTLVAASAALLVTLRRSHVDGVREPAELRAADVVAVVDRGQPTGSLDLDEGEDRFVQVVQDGAVVAASATVAGTGPLTGDETAGRLPGDPDDEWVVVVEQAASGATVVVGREVDGAAETLGPAVSALAVGVPLLLVVVGATTWMVVGRALAPVEAIRSEVEEIGDTDLGRRVPGSDGADEVARLAATMNAMLDRLEAARSRQRRFVADASHELRSPVAAIRQHAEVAGAHPDRTTVPELAAAVLVEDLRLQRLVEDMLVLTRRDDGAGAPGRDVDLDDLLLAEARRWGSPSVRFDTTGIGAARVHGDERGLTRAVANVVENAVRHARSTVRLVSSEADGVASVEVHDDGGGIPEAERHRVFERFVRLDDARDRDAGGVGLGLAIVDSIVTDHGGSVAIDASPLGGAMVTIRLPTMEEHLP